MNHFILSLLIFISGTAARAQVNCSQTVDYNQTYETGSTDANENHSSLDFEMPLSPAQSLANVAMIMPYVKYASRELCLPEEIKLHAELALLQNSVNSARNYKDDSTALKSFDETRTEITGNLDSLRELNVASVRQAHVAKHVQLFYDAVHGGKNVTIACVQILAGELKGIHALYRPQNHVDSRETTTGRIGRDHLPHADENEFSDRNSLFLKRRKNDRCKG